MICLDLLNQLYKFVNEKCLLIQITVGDKKIKRKYTNIFFINLLFSFSLFLIRILTRINIIYILLLLIILLNAINLSS